MTESLLPHLQPTIRKFNLFLKEDLRPAIIAAARAHEILSEADLHIFCFGHIRHWIKKRDSRGIFRIHNKLFLRQFHNYPDIVILRKKRPWALIELKEQRLLKASVANADATKLAGISYSPRISGTPRGRCVIRIGVDKVVDATIDGEVRAGRNVNNCTGLPISGNGF